MSPLVISSEPLPERYRSFFKGINARTQFCDPDIGELRLFGKKENGWKDPVIIYGVDTFSQLDTYCLPDKFYVVVREGEIPPSDLEWIAESALFGKP